MGHKHNTIEEKQAKSTVNPTKERRKAEPVYPIEMQLVKYGEDADGQPLEITIPVAPEFLSESAKELWQRNCMQLAVMSLFPNSAYEYLVTYCQLYDVAKQAKDILDRTGLTLISEANGSEIINPNYRLWTDSFDRMMTIGAKFGFTPLDKAKLSSKALDEGAKRKDKNEQKRITVSG